LTNKQPHIFDRSNNKIKWNYNSPHVHTNTRTVPRGCYTILLHIVVKGMSIRVCIGVYSVMFAVEERLRQPVT